MTKEEYERERKRVKDYQETWEELGIFEQALAEVEHPDDITLNCLSICIREYGLHTGVRKLLESRIKGLEEELKSI